MHVAWASEILQNSTEAPPPATLLLPQALAAWQPLRLTPATAAAARRRPRTCTRGGSPGGTAPACARAAQPSEQGRGTWRVSVLAGQACANPTRQWTTRAHTQHFKTCTLMTWYAWACYHAPHPHFLLLPTCASPSSAATSFTMRTVCMGAGRGQLWCMVGVPHGLPPGTRSCSTSVHQAHTHCTTPAPPPWLACSTAPSNSGPPYLSIQAW